ncbi:hypothetical protein [Rhodococcus sp. JVH1]|uniref:hypothetical protein n=1 Tax=Rhodococcus sp. JVH1 TaxID=745408 RepID=UPI000A01C43C
MAVLGSAQLLDRRRLRRQRWPGVVLARSTYSSLGTGSVDALRRGPRSVCRRWHKTVQLNGAPVPTATSSMWWGEPGTNGLHAFYQLLYQGTRLVNENLDFAEPTEDLRAIDEEYARHPRQQPSHAAARPCVRPHRRRASRTWSLRRRTFAEDVLCNINPSDQWGAELGKTPDLELQTALSDRRGRLGPCTVVR